ncbi:unnamed protein product [Nezara viridula]|uniref:Mitochondrial pyruvate carrier n=1 Tax=Nezara viridula TaxID=85310 RepID=A0A9P0HFI3_NEZVI|nr:unnamed protein product [Nezara viridula]
MSIIYRRGIHMLDKLIPARLQPLWSHEAGPKTIFFWAPAVKWGLVIAGIGDLTRPIENVSISQSAALSGTGVVWARYSLVIIPKNWSLFAVNIFVASSGIYQCVRRFRYEQALKMKDAEIS